MIRFFWSLGCCFSEKVTKAEPLQTASFLAKKNGKCFLGCDCCLRCEIHLKTKIPSAYLHTWSCNAILSNTLYHTVYQPVHSYLKLQVTSSIQWPVSWPLLASRFCSTHYEFHLLHADVISVHSMVFSKFNTLNTFNVFRSLFEREIVLSALGISAPGSFYFKWYAILSGLLYRYEDSSFCSQILEP